LYNAELSAYLLGLGSGQLLVQSQEDVYVNVFPKGYLTLEAFGD